jgi:hypothetical protein
MSVRAIWCSRLSARNYVKSERAPPKVPKLALFLLSLKNFNEAEHSKNVFCIHVFMTKVKVFEKKVKDHWVKVMLSNGRSCQKEYTCEITYQSKVMTKVKVFEKKVKLQGQRVKVMVSNERSCQKEYTCEI